MKRENPDVEVALPTTDRNMRIMAEAYGVPLRYLITEANMKIFVRSYIMIALGACLTVFGCYYSPNVMGYWCFMIGMFTFVIGFVNVVARKIGYSKSGNGASLGNDDDACSENIKNPTIKNLQIGISDPAKWIRF